MPDVPPEAVRAAREVLYEARYNLAHLESWDFTDLARKMLEAAAPAMAGHVADKITAHKYEHEPKGPLIGGRTAEDQRRRTWRRHFAIAARVAANAFCTGEDVKRLAAEALDRGDFIACPDPEPREDEDRG